jgi:hypothetical protein
MKKLFLSPSGHLQALPLVLTLLALFISNFPFPQLLSEAALQWRVVTRHFWMALIGALPSALSISITPRQSDALTLFVLLALPPVWALYAPTALRKFFGWLLGIFIDVRKPELQIAQEEGTTSTARRLSVILTVALIAIVLIDSVVRLASLGLLAWILFAGLGLLLLVGLMGKISDGDGEAALGCIFLMGGAPLVVAFILLMIILVTPGHMILQMFDVTPGYGFLYQVACVLVAACVGFLIFLNAWFAPMVMPTVFFYLSMIVVTSTAYSIWTGRDSELSKYVNLSEPDLRNLDEQTSAPSGLAAYCSSEIPLREKLESTAVSLNLLMKSEIEDQLEKNLAALSLGAASRVTVPWHTATASGTLELDCNLVLPSCYEPNRLTIQVTQGFFARFLFAVTRHDTDTRQLRRLSAVLDSKSTRTIDTQPILQRLLREHELRPQSLRDATQVCAKAYLERIKVLYPKKAAEAAP